VRSRLSVERLPADRKKKRGADVRKSIPFRTTGRRRGGKSRTVEDQVPPTRCTDAEEDIVTIQLKDGTWETVHGKNLELDVEYRQGVPYLVVRERR
jgi:hypothetical protein